MYIMLFLYSLIINIGQDPGGVVALASPGDCEPVHPSTAGPAREARYVYIYIYIYMRKAACGAQIFGIFYDEKVCFA